MVFDQASYEIRCEWGEQGLRTLAPISEAVVIIDVLSFTTSVDIATARGALVYPYGTQNIPLELYAKEKQAIIAHRPKAGVQGYTLSPSSLLEIPEGTRLVLPSPNGSMLSSLAMDKLTFAACLRNAASVADTVQKHADSIAVIPAGERWWSGDKSLRPSLEDMLGAGAVIHYLKGKKSPEAKWAETTFLHFRDNLLETLTGISSGKELIEKGLKEDIVLASRLNTSENVPRLTNEAYETTSNLII